MSFLTGLGDVAGGFSQGINPYLQDYLKQMQETNDDTAAGLGVYAALGVTPPGQGGMGQVAPRLPSPAPAAPAAAPPPSPSPTALAPPSLLPGPQASFPQFSALQTPPSTPSLGQGGTARSPMPAPQATPAPVPAPTPFTSQNAAQAIPQSTVMPPQRQPLPTANLITGAQNAGPIAGAQNVAPGALAAAQPAPAASPLPASAPRTGPPLSSAAAVAQPRQTPSPPPAQPPPQQNQRRDQDSAAQGPDLGKFDGMFDYNTLARNLVRTPGMTPTKLGRIISSRGFQNMLNQEGLQQYRAAGLAIRRDVDERGWSDLDRKTRQGDRRIAATEDWRTRLDATRRAIVTGQATLQGINKAASDAVATVRQDQVAGNLTADEAQKKIDTIEEDRQKKIADVVKTMQEAPPEAPKDDDGSPDSGGSLIDKAKAAIAAGKPRDAVIKRLKELDPSADTSGL